MSNIAQRVAARYLTRTAGFEDEPEYPAETVFVYWYPSEESYEGYEVTIFVDTDQDVKILEVKADEGAGSNVPVEKFESMVPDDEMDKLMDEAIDAAREKAIDEWSKKPAVDPEEIEAAIADAKNDAQRDEKYGYGYWSS